MNRLQKSNSVWLGFDIKLSPHSGFKPQKIQFWKPEAFKNQKPEAPFTYMSDALVGLSLIHLNTYFRSPVAHPELNLQFCDQAWRSLDPHIELFQRSRPRLQSLRKGSKPQDQAVIDAFERIASENIECSMHPWGLDLQNLATLVDAIDHLEGKTKKPLLYNFDLTLEKSFVQKLHFLHSLLFHLRALIALDFNAHVQDVSHEAVKVDSITDYVQRAEYIANDALLYWQFLKHEEKMPETTFLSLKKTFQQLSHNGACLIENLPKSHINELSKDGFTESLYSLQMDWLLGSDAGLIFRIREELYGLKEGYDRVFWPEAEGRSAKKKNSLAVNCQVTSRDLGDQSIAV